ncbi:hypothetical protein FEM48_Zijuj07G0058500 [Ziziphus jujuba var. spinosa]|uniref:Receptor ligand binding region domain-containing protein n=1 Tax=Ziziphus jujuba var. spinosa TaxID=714518 RepID=A0A978V2U6_ZIZJJ|nr:hypothetical protein FEM48_Zijuj07G0058500 [Ziziphus jujuba var. spinosa]
METRNWEKITNIIAILFTVIFLSLVGQCVAVDFNNITHHEDEVHVGVVLDMGSKEGKIVHSCISMEVSDFYQLHNSYTTRLLLHARDSKGEPLHALSAGMTLTSYLVSFTNYDNIVEELYKLKDFQTKVFIVHMSEAPVSKLLINAKRLGTISEGYACFVTASTMNLLGFVDSFVIGSMQGLVGFKSYIPPTKDHQNLALRLRRKFSIELSVYGIWAYDSIWALAEAVERARDYNKLVSGIKNGSLLVEEILRSRFLGLSGFKPYSSLEEYAEALSKGSKHGGVSAIVDEVPYIKKFVAKYPGDYTVKTMPMSNTNGFGYEAGELAVLETCSRAYSEEALLSPSDDSANDPHVLRLDFFRGLFLISGISSVLAFLLFFSFAIEEKMEFLKYRNIVQLMALEKCEEIPLQ